MTNILRRELRSYFERKFGYLATALLLFAWLGALTIFNLGSQSSDLSGALTVLSLLLVLFAPLVSMYALPEERRSGSERLLFSLPLSTASIALGKYFAILLLFLIPTSASMLLSLLFSVWGTASVLSIFTAWIGFLGLAAVSLALCLFLSSLAKTPRAAYFYSLFGMLALNLLANLPLWLPSAPWVSLVCALLLSAAASVPLWLRARKPLPPLLVGGGLALASLIAYFAAGKDFPSLLSVCLSSLNPFLQSRGFSYGRIDLISLLLDIALVAILLFLTVRQLNNRRILDGAEDTEEKEASPLALTQKRAHAVRSDLLACLLLCLCLIFSSLSCVFPRQLLHPALAKDGAFSITAKTKDLLASLSETVTVSFAVAGGKSFAEGEIYDFLQEFTSLSPNLTLQVIDTLHRPDLLAEHGLDPKESDGYLIVQSARRERVLPSDALYYYKNASFGYERMTVSEYLYQCAYIEEKGYGDDYLYQFIESTTPYFDGQATLLNAIGFVCAERVPILYLMADGNGSVPDDALYFSLQQAGVGIKYLAVGASVPADCDLLLLHSPTKDLSAEGAAALSSYLSSGGKLLLTTSYRAGILPRLQSVLSQFGLSYGPADSVILEGNASYAYSAEYPHLFYAHAAEHPTTQGFAERIFLPFAHSIQCTEVEGVTLTPWLYTSDRAYLASLAEERAEEEPARAVYHAGVIAQRGSGTVVWISTPDAISSTGDAFSEGGNLLLAKRTVLWLTDAPDLSVTVAANPMDTGRLNTGSGILVLGVLLSICAPTAVLVTGFLITGRKKRR
ncbi:MAG: Gldg family protein [Clostridia bacterium]|nr:Gldg family protein [Clostridia bacterium]